MIRKSMKWKEGWEELFEKMRSSYFVLKTISGKKEWREPKNWLQVSLKIIKMKLSRKLSTGREKNETSNHKYKRVKKSKHIEKFAFEVVHINVSK